MRANRSALKAATAAGFLTATDLADWLVRVLGMPFRRAHHVTGSIVKLAEERGCGLADLPLDAMQAIEPGITEDIFSRSEEHTSELQSLMRISYAVFCLKKKKQ